MPITEKTWKEVTTPNERGRALLGDHPEFRREVLERLEDTNKWPNVLGIVFFENVTLDSSHCGATQVLVYGPGHTLAAIEPLIANPMQHRLGDLPSTFQYPQWYITRAAHLATK